jgi:MFS family permease
MTEARTKTDRLMLFFALVYVVEGIGQARFGIVAQPLTAWLKGAGWTPLEITAFLAIPNLPWMIKPLFGILSDCVPLFGSRRRAYLIMANGLAIAAYGWMSVVATPAEVAFPLLLTGYAMAIASTLCGALLVENGQRMGQSGAFVGQQWLWFNIAMVASAFAGGELVEQLSATGALRAASAVAAIAPVPVLFSIRKLIDEAPVHANLRSRLATIGRALASGRLWLIGLVLFLYAFSPGFGTPLYFHMTDDLQFSQSLIGTMNAVNSIGGIVGALLYRQFLRDRPARLLLYLGVLVGTLSTLSFLWLRGETSGLLINFGNGMAGMIATIASLTFAAEICPEGAEGFAFAALMSIINLADPVSSTSGAWLYEHPFASHLSPLIMISAAATAVAALFIPLLRD